MRLYNPRSGAEFDTESDDELHNQVYLDMGFLPAPEPEPAPIGRTPEPIIYAPVTKASASSRPAASATRNEWADYVDHLGGDSDGKTIAELKAAADELESE